MSAPVAMSRKIVTARPKMQSLASGDVVVRHREYIRDIGGSIGFAAEAFPINPGQAQTFPWLSSLASRFESYRFMRLAFELNNLAPTSETGTVALAVDYDAADPAPASKLQALSYRSSVRVSPWRSVRFESLPEDLHRTSTYYLRTAAVLSGGLDIKMYDVGNLFVITQGQISPGAGVSELYVEYEVILMTPQIDFLGSTVGARLSGTVGLTATALFGTDATVDAESTLALTVDTTSGASVKFNQDFTGLWIMEVTGTGLADVTTSGPNPTIASTLFMSVGTDSTTLVWVGQVAAQAGQLLELGITETTVTSVLHVVSAFPANIL